MKKLQKIKEIEGQFAAISFMPDPDFENQVEVICGVFSSRAEALEFLTNPDESENRNKSTGTGSIRPLRAIKKMLNEVVSLAPEGVCFVITPSDGRRSRVYRQALIREGWSFDSWSGQIWLCIGQNWCPMP